MSKFVLSLIVVTLATVSCTPVGQATRPLGKSPGEIKSGDEDIPSTLQICSDLDFSGVVWSPTLPIVEREPFALALNITGSFEGGKGFENLTGNFDGQGVSMGLLQQNFGQGSLQPLMLLHLARDARSFKSFFTSSHATSLIGMLDKWKTSVSSTSFRISDEGYSELDDPEAIAAELGLPVFKVQSLLSSLATRNQTSVDWAKANVLTGTKIKSDWQTELTALAGSSQYRSLQIEEAETLHRRALVLFDYFQMTELRSYLFFFDIIIQNGGIPQSMRDSITAELANLPHATETEILKLILERRLTLVKQEWRNDVRLRKTSIIDGKGRVHGSDRDYNKEYCTNIFVPMP